LNDPKVLNQRIFYLGHPAALPHMEGCFIILLKTEFASDTLLLDIKIMA
jgi:hypothetical protein